MTRYFWGACAVSALAAFAWPAMAQDTASDQDTVAQNTEEETIPYAIALDPITVFATLSPIASFDYPGQVSVVEREDIQTEQANSISDVLKDVPGVFVDGGARRSGQAPTIRGFREEDILILVDGVKQSFISGHDGRIFIEPDLLKSVEVIKGPMSALYGSGALGGVIALTTVDAADFLDPGETAGVRVKAGYQSVNEEFSITSTGFARSKDGKFDVVSSFTYREGGDIALGDGTTIPDDEQIKSSLVKGTAQITPDLKFVGTWVHFDEDAFNPANSQSDTSGLGFPTERNPNVDRFVQSDTLSGKLSYNPATNPLIDANLLVYWANHSNEEDDTTSTRLTNLEVETTGVNVDNRSRFDLFEGAKLTLTYGGEYYVDRQTGADNAPVGGAGAVKNTPDADATYYGVFTQAEFKFDTPLGLPGELTVLPGVRWDGFENNYKGTEDYDDFDEQAISKKLGISYKPMSWLMLFGSYGEAFRAPSYNELYAQGNHFPGGLETTLLQPPAPPIVVPTGNLIYNQFVSNPALKPQDGTTLEAGLGFDFKDLIEGGDRLTMKGSYWQTDAKNFIDLEVETAGCSSFTPNASGQWTLSDPSSCYSQFINRNAELDGIEIMAKYDASRWYLGAAYTHIDGVDTDNGEYLGILQPDKIVIDAGVKVPEIWSRFGMRATFADEFTKFNPPSSAEDVPEGPRDAYTLLDIYAVIEPTEGPLQGFRLDLGVDNVTDEDYEVIAAGVYEEGINYKAALSWTHKW